MAKKPLVIIAGATGIGKSAIAVEIAQKIDGEIISADSMQVYRHMDIGSAKIRPDEMQGITHHMIDILDPRENFDVVQFKNRAKACIEDIISRKKLPIITGGTGFYIQALLYDVEFGEEDGSREIRERLQGLYTKEGAEYLYRMLLHIDPESAAIIHPNNIKRVIRALEYYEIYREPISAHNKKQHERKSAYNALYTAITDDRVAMYANIEKRVDAMMNQGLVEEVRELMDMGLNTTDHISMQGLGYKEIYDYLTGETDLERAVYLIKRDTRHFAKRQLTWLRREREVCWVDKRDFHRDNREIAEHICKLIKERVSDCI